MSIFKICKNVFIKHGRDSKLLKMYNFDHLNHRDVNYYFSEYLYVNRKSAQNLENTYFRSKMHYIHIADHLHKSLFKLSK